MASRSRWSGSVQLFTVYLSWRRQRSVGGCSMLASAHYCGGKHNEQAKPRAPGPGRGMGGPRADRALQAGVGHHRAIRGELVAGAGLPDANRDHQRRSPGSPNEALGPDRLEPNRPLTPTAAGTLPAGGDVGNPATSSLIHTLSHR
jgi:hypothetical protein